MIREDENTKKTRTVLVGGGFYQEMVGCFVSFDSYTLNGCGETKEDIDKRHSEER